MLKSTKKPCFRIYRPPADIEAGALIVSSPHSGRDYSPFDQNDLQCSYDELRLLEDTLMDQVCSLSALGQLGVTAIEALFPRSYVDPNRKVTSLDQSQIRDGHHLQMLACRPDNYTATGLSVVPIGSQVEDVQIYKEGHLPTEAEILKRLKLYQKYHDALQRTVHDAFNRHGRYTLLDMHSCSPNGAKRDGVDGLPRADIILSNRDGKSCGNDFVQAVMGAYQQEGIKAIAVNEPFHGGYITELYGKHNADPSMNKNVRSLQIEVNKRLYLDSTLIDPNANFEAFQIIQYRVFQKISEYCALEVK